MSERIRSPFQAMLMLMLMILMQKYVMERTDIPRVLHPHPLDVLTQFSLWESQAMPHEGISPTT